MCCVFGESSIMKERMKEAEWINKDSSSPTTSCIFKSPRSLSETVTSGPQLQDSRTSLARDIGLNLLKVFQMFWMCCQAWEFMFAETQQPGKEGIIQEIQSLSVSDGGAWLQMTSQNYQNLKVMRYSTLVDISLALIGWNLA